ncbi:MAG: sugar phosphate isomerase/epimerase [Oscillospiraceae bacterium]|nr:sugar phosphate isomerase/epimerase [Oscillospiraceae bacterium]
MEIGINLYPKWPYEEVIAAFAENGIARTFVNIEHPEFEKAMEALEKNSIVVDNFHAPFKGLNAIWEPGEAGDEMLRRLMGGVDACVKYNVKVMVGHVSNGRPMPPISPVGLDRYDRLMAYAKEKGITIAFESHRFVENVRYFMERYPQAGFCLDTSHEDAFTPGVRYMPMWGHRLVATHLSDNEYVCDYDMHMIPFDGHIEWDKTAREIAQCGRDVTLMLEVKPDNHEKYKNVSIKDYFAAAAKSIKCFAEMVENCKIDPCNT